MFKSAGIRGVLGAVVRRLRMPHALSFASARAIVAGAKGIEIGGPSALFARGGLMPLYPVAARVDNCNFARSTLWEEAIDEGDSFVFHRGKAPGRQFIAEGGNLRAIPSAAYDFVLSSNMLEHTANPLGALVEWKRLLKPGGGLILIVPHRDGTFDHRRPITSLDHLKEDFAANTGEDDLTHLAEVLALHDLAKDTGESRESLQRRLERNAQVRSMHHHVFDTRLAAAAVMEAGYDVLSLEGLPPYNIVVLARKPVDGAGPSGTLPMSASAVLKNSPFRTDRQ